MSSVENAMVAGHATAALTEADRLMVVCNSCRYCEGLCAVFPAMEMRRAFGDGDLNYLANLCHNCGACYDDCQFSPPHEFEVNVPQTLAVVRNDSYKAYVWPRALAGLFERNGLAIASIAAASVAIFLIWLAAINGEGNFWSRHVGTGAFYQIVGHNTLAVLFGSVFLYAMFAIGMGVMAFWQDIGEPFATLRRPDSIWQAMKDAGQMRYLDGGGGGCAQPGTSIKDSRKHYHHATFYGFLLCLASTSTATIYHFVFGWEAPYAWYDLPVVLGTVGGVGLVVGTAGLLGIKLRRPSHLYDSSRSGMDIAFIVMLFLTGATGLVLLVLRETPLLGLLLAIHLGVVFALFLTMPYGKFVHGIYRYLALVRYAREHKTQVPIAD